MKHFFFCAACANRELPLLVKLCLVDGRVVEYTHDSELEVSTRPGEYLGTGVEFGQTTNPRLQADSGFQLQLLTC